jgi:SapC
LITTHLHTNAVALDRDAHRSLKLKLPVTDWGVAARLNAIFIAAVEFGDVAREYPIVFVRAGKDEAGKELIAPVAVLGLALEQNLYLDGPAWKANYIPAVVRAYPFAIGRIDTQRFAICVDMAWPGANQQEGDAVFTATGEPTELLSGTQKHLEMLEGEVQRTREVCQRLQGADILRDMRFDAELPDGRKHTVDGFMTIDEARMKELPDATVLQFHRDGLLGLVHAHWMSMHHMQRLLQLHMEKQPAAPVAANS